MAILLLFFCPSVEGQDTGADIHMQIPRSAVPPTPSPSPAAGAPADDDRWHVDLTPYLWFPGMHGTAGARDHNASVHASTADLLSHFRFGVMGAASARYKRYLLYGDLFWVRLRDDHALPITDPFAISADVRVGELIWTSKAGYRVIDHEKFKLDGDIGLRYWHLGQKFSLNPSIFGNAITGSQNWADFIIGGRGEMPLSPKAAVELGGDVGGWGAAAKLDYQFGALLGYKLSSRWKLQAGYRYMLLDRRQGTGVFNVVQAGPALAATYTLK